MVFQEARAGQSVSRFDYDAPAELFLGRLRKGRGIQYRRFDTAAEAIRFAMEELPPSMLVGAHLLVQEERFAGDEIRELYESAAYPLDRPG